MTRAWYSWLERHEGFLERWYPWTAGLAAGVLASATMTPAFEKRAAQALVDPIITVAAIAIAFFVAVAVMLAPLKSTEPVILELQRIDVFPLILDYIRSAIYVWGAVIILGLSVKVVPENATAFGALLTPGRLTALPRILWLHLLASAMAAALVAGALAGHRAVVILFAFLRYRDPRKIKPRPAPPSGGDDEPLVLPEPRRRAAR